MILNNIEKILIEKFKPYHIELDDQSASHSNHYDNYDKNTVSHLHGLIVSDIFRDKNLLSRQRMLNEVIKNFFLDGLHAISIKLISVDEHIKDVNYFKK